MSEVKNASETPQEKQKDVGEWLSDAFTKVKDTVLQTERTAKEKEAMQKTLATQKDQLDGVAKKYHEEKASVIGTSNQSKVELLAEIKATASRLEMEKNPTAIGGDDSQRKMAEDVYEKLEAKITGSKETVDFKNPEFIEGAIKNLNDFAKALDTAPTKAPDATVATPAEGTKEAKKPESGIPTPPTKDTPAAPAKEAAGTPAKDAPAKEVPAATPAKPGEVSKPTAPEKPKDKLTGKYESYSDKFIKDRDAGKALDENKKLGDEDKKGLKEKLGNPTIKNVREIQLAIGMGIEKADGVFGPKTLEALQKVEKLQKVESADVDKAYAASAARRSGSSKK